MKKKLAVILVCSMLGLTLSGCVADREANSLSDGSIEIERSESAGTSSGMDETEEKTTAEGDKSVTEPADAESFVMPEPDGTVPFGNSVTLDGHQLMDGSETPVRVTMTVNSVVRGSHAYEMMKDYSADIEEPREGMEYAIMGILITYEEGEPVLTLEESHASLDSAKLYFAMTDKDGNAEQLTNLLNNSFYDISLEAGKSASGAVAFLISEDSSGPLNFTGWGQTISFGIVQACF